MKHTNKKKAFITVSLILALLPGCSITLQPPIVIKPTEAPTETAPAPTEAPAETAAAQTGQAAQPAQQYTDHTNLLTSQNQREINIFLSNFSEVEMGDYDASNPSNDLLIYFGTHHLQINKNQLADPSSLRHISAEQAYEHFAISPGGGNFYAANASAVAATVDRYFGKGITSASIRYNGWYVTYENNEYFFDCKPESDHYVSPIFSIAQSMYQNSDGSYTVEFKNYLSMILDVDIYGLTAADSPDAYCLIPNGSGVAVIAPYSGSTTTKYHLIRYNTRSY
ncbi:MAG: hypothetical protein ACI4EA_01625 [Candidatus Ornithomonoglobus sp.]